MPKAKKSGTSQESDVEIPIGVKALQYLNIQQQIKKLTAELKAVRTTVEGYLKEHGEVDANSGHILCVVTHAGSDIELRHQIASSACLKEEAIDILKKDKGLKKYVETVEVVREDLLTVAIKAGDIDTKTALKLFDEKETKSFIVKLIK